MATDLLLLFSRLIFWKDVADAVSIDQHAVSINNTLYDESSHKKYSTRAINMDIGNDSFGGRNYGNQPS